MPFDESKVNRDAGKFASKPGAGSKSSKAAAEYGDEKYGVPSELSDDRITTQISMLERMLDAPVTKRVRQRDGSLSEPRKVSRPLRETSAIKDRLDSLRSEQSRRKRKARGGGGDTESKLKALGEAMDATDDADEFEELRDQYGALAGKAAGEKVRAMSPAERVKALQGAMLWDLAERVDEDPDAKAAYRALKSGKLEGLKSNSAVGELAHEATKRGDFMPAALIGSSIAMRDESVFQRPTPSDEASGIIGFFDSNRVVRFAFDESKVNRDKGKFSSKPGAKGKGHADKRGVASVVSHLKPAHRDFLDSYVDDAVKGGTGEAQDLVGALEDMRGKGLLSSDDVDAVMAYAKEQRSSGEGDQLRDEDTVEGHDADPKNGAKAVAGAKDLGGAIEAAMRWADLQEDDGDMAGDLEASLGESEFEDVAAEYERGNVDDDVMATAADSTSRSSSAGA